MSTSGHLLLPRESFGEFKCNKNRAVRYILRDLVQSAVFEYIICW